MELARVLALDPPLSDADWFEWDFIPLWVSYAITLLPILSIVGTAWSLRHSLMRSGSKNRSGSLNNNNNNSTMPTPLALVSAIGAPAPVAVPRDRSISQSIVDLPSSARRALLSSLSKIRSPAPSDGTLPDDPSSPPVVGAVGGAGLRPPARRDDGEGSCHSELAVRVRHSRVKYPLTATFVVLSVLVIVFWTVGVAVTISSSIGPLRTTAIVVLAQALELTAESSFEFLLRFSRSSASPQQNQHWRQQKQQQRRTSAAPSFTPSPEELQRRESNFVQSSPFTASVISWTSPDPQQAAAATDLEASSPLSWTDPPI
ncbi:hypothetical protein BC828DRAFT_375134 [Blastocladiella britannica]|nr:hypothetical protein BC828DRAFT_375134 [Blastocladiella britannica]